MKTLKQQMTPEMTAYLDSIKPGLIAAMIDGQAQFGNDFVVIVDSDKDASGIMTAPTQLAIQKLRKCGFDRMADIISVQPSHHSARWVLLPGKYYGVLSIATQDMTPLVSA